MKRLMDIILAIFASILFFVPAIIIASCVRATSKGPALYWSERMGRNGQPFMMPKFRTMDIKTPVVPTNALINPELYITSLGRFLRRSSLDELPQLYSVVCGKMSLVGPRPVLTSETDVLKVREKLGINVLRPGITGWAQINGRDSIIASEKIRFDEEYLKRQSNLFDIEIMYRTIFYVLKSKGIWH